MIHSQRTSYLSSVLSASEMAGFLTAVLHAWLLLEEKGVILNQNSTLQTSLHNINIKRLITSSRSFYYATKYNINEFLRGKQGIRSNVLHSFCSTNTSLLHLTSCQPWSFEYVVLGQIWINAQRSWRANCANYGIINCRKGSGMVSRSAVLLCGLMGQWYKDIKSPRQGLERGEAWWPGCLWSRDQRRTTLRLSEHKRAGGNGEKGRWCRK